MKRASVNVRMRRFLYRVAWYLRPPAVQVPLSLDQILGAQQGIDLVQRFNDLYYRSGTPGELNWRGDRVSKNPCDLWMVVELLQRIRPAVLVETGTNYGGSASFYADILKILEIQAEVITVDFNPKWSFKPADKSITSIVGYSTDAHVFEQVSNAVSKALQRRTGPVMVLLDSDHNEANVSRELELYSRFVTVGSYLIVEDTNINGHPSSPEFGPGPWEAVDKFLRQRKDFVVDRDCERFLLTFFPGGWLKRVA